jgi:hypothetical protein
MYGDIVDTWAAERAEMTIEYGHSRCNQIIAVEVIFVTSCEISPTPSGRRIDS